MKTEDDAMEATMGRLLQVGVLVAATVVLAGGALYLVRHGREPVRLRDFAGEPAALETPQGTVAYAVSGHGRGIIQVGLLLLVATPIARVAFSAYAFFRQRDFTYVAITLLVLSLLAFSLWSGLG